MANKVPLKIEGGELKQFQTGDTISATIAPGSGGGGANVGVATLNFGAFPGKSDATVDVVSAGLVAGSIIEAWIRPAASADHSADEHMLETLKVFGVYLSDGNLRIYGINTSQLSEPIEPGNRGGTGGKGTRLYGAWSVAWVWN